MVSISIDNRVRISLEGVPEELIAEIREAFDHDNPEFGKRQAMGLSTYRVERVLQTWRADDAHKILDVPRGGFARVVEALSDVDRHYIDDRTIGDPELAGKIPDYEFVDLWPHQSACVEACIRREQGIVKAPTGSGKTTFAFALAARLKLPTLVIVPTRALFNQWLGRADKELGIRKSKVGVIQGKRFRLAPLTIAMQKSLAVRGVDAELADTFGLIICDEVQLFAAKTFFSVVDPFRARYRIGVSAEHRRKDRREFLTHDLFGPVIAEISRAELIRSGVIVDTEVRVVPTDFEAAWYGMPEEREGFDEFAPDAEVVEKEIDFNRLLGEMTHDRERNALVLWVIEQGRAGGEQVLVMSHRRDDCRLIDQLLVMRSVRTGFLIGGEDYRVQFEQTSAAFQAGTLDVGVGTFQAIGFGIDFPRASVVVCATPIAANRQTFGQVRGRVCRSAKGKKDSWLYYLWDRRVYGISHLRNLLRWNRGRVVVWDHGRWVDAKTYLQAIRIEGANEKARRGPSSSATAG